MDESRERDTDHALLALQVGTTLVSLRVGQSLVLGSAEGCDIRLAHRAVEPRHALLRVQEGRVLLDDLDSRSGTYVAGQRVEQFDLKPGDIAVLGEIPVKLVAGARGQDSLGAVPMGDVSGEELSSACVPKPRSARNLPIRMRDEATFRDLMAEELSRTPWFTLSMIIHVALLLIFYFLLQPPPPGGAESVQIATRGGIGDLPDEAFISGDEPIELEEPEPTLELEEELDDREAFESALDRSDFLWPVQGGFDKQELFLSKVSPRNPTVDDILKSGGAGLSTGGFRDSVSGMRETGLEIVFVFDSTGSMGSVLEMTKARIGRMLEVLQALVPDTRVGIVTFRDHGQDENYLTRSIPLGQDFYRAINFMQVIDAGGGGDRPEAVHAGLKVAFKQNWRRGAQRVVVLIGDAPPRRGSMGSIKKAARAFTRDGSSYLHAIVTHPNGGRRAPKNTLESFEQIARAGNGQCLPFEDEESILMQVLSLAFGEEYRSNLEEVYRIVDNRNSESVKTRRLPRNSNGTLLRRRLARKPVPDDFVREVIRRPSEELALQLVEILSRPRYSEPGRHAASYALQHILGLRSPPLDPEEGGRLPPPAAKHLAALVKDRF